MKTCGKVNPINHPLTTDGLDGNHPKINKIIGLLLDGIIEIG